MQNYDMLFGIWKKGEGGRGKGERGAYAALFFSPLANFTLHPSPFTLHPSPFKKLESLMSDEKVFLCRVMDQRTANIFQFFAYAHLPPCLQAFSAPCHTLACAMITLLPDSQELTVGLRKLLEAKDCFVRAGIQTGPASQGGLREEGGRGKREEEASAARRSLLGRATPESASKDRVDQTQHLRHSLPPA